MANELWSSISEVICGEYRKHLEPGVLPVNRWKVFWVGVNRVLSWKELRTWSWLYSGIRPQYSLTEGPLAICHINTLASETHHWKKREGLPLLLLWESKGASGMWRPHICFPSLSSLLRESQPLESQQAAGEITSLTSPPRIWSSSLQMGPRNQHI